MTDRIERSKRHSLRHPKTSIALAIALSFTCTYSFAQSDDPCRVRQTGEPTSIATVWSQTYELPYASEGTVCDVSAQISLDGGANIIKTSGLSGHVGSITVLQRGAKYVVNWQADKDRVRYQTTGSQVRFVIYGRVERNTTTTRETGRSFPSPIPPLPVPERPVSVERAPTTHAPPREDIEYTDEKYAHAVWATAFGSLRREGVGDEFDSRVGGVAAGIDSFVKRELGVRIALSYSTQGATVDSSGFSYYFSPVATDFTFTASAMLRRRLARLIEIRGLAGGGYIITWIDSDYGVHDSNTSLLLTASPEIVYKATEHIDLLLGLNAMWREQRRSELKRGLVRGVAGLAVKF